MNEAIIGGQLSSRCLGRASYSRGKSKIAAGFCLAGRRLLSRFIAIYHPNDTLLRFVKARACDYYRLPGDPLIRGNKVTVLWKTQNATMALLFRWHFSVDFSFIILVNICSDFLIVYITGEKWQDTYQAISRNIISPFDILLPRQTLLSYSIFIFVLSILG